MPAATVPSPCVGVCRIGTGAAPLCVGCLRSLDEIAQWPHASDAQKRAIWRRIGQRRAAGQPTTATKIMAENPSTARATAENAMTASQAAMPKNAPGTP